MSRVPGWFLWATVAVWIAYHLTHNRELGGLWVLMLLYELTWGFDEWRARRRQTRARR